MSKRKAFEPRTARVSSTPIRYIKPKGQHTPIPVFRGILVSLARQYRADARRVRRIEMKKGGMLAFLARQYRAGVRRIEKEKE